MLTASSPNFTKCRKRFEVPQRIEAEKFFVCSNICKLVSEDTVPRRGGRELLGPLIVDRGLQKGAHVCFDLLDCCLHALDNDDLRNLFDEVS